MEASAQPLADAGAAPEIRKQKKKKVLLMGKSGSGKSSMRSIIFSNYVARDTRRLGATIDVDLSHVKFLGNLTLNLWDCGGQDAFMENYLSQQRSHVFSNVGVLIYVFDIESRDFDRDLLTYRSIISALSQFSPTSSVYILIHKMDLVAPAQREASYNDRIAAIRTKSDVFDPVPFATSIWDQSLYKAWAEIIHDLVPNLSSIERHLATLGTLIEAEEVLLFERSSFLVVSHWCSSVGSSNPTTDRFERLSNIIKNFKQSTSRYTGTPKSAEQFVLLELKLSRFCMFVVKFSTNTYLAVVLPPGEERFNAALENAMQARKEFESLDSAPRRGPDRGLPGAWDLKIFLGDGTEHLSAHPRRQPAMIPSRGIQWSSRTIGIGRRRLEDISIRSFSSSTTRNARLPAAPFGALSSKAAARPKFMQSSSILTQLPSRRFNSSKAAATTTTAATTPGAPTTDALAGTSSAYNTSLDDAIDIITSAKDVPEHIGYLKSLGLDYGYGPTSVVEWLLEHTHVYCGTPWWASIALTAVIIRVVFMKLYIAAADNGARMARVAPKTKPLHAKMMELQRNNDQAGMMSVRRELQIIHERAGVKMWKSLLPMVQVFTGYGTFVLLRAMGKLPVPGLETGGVLWFQNLTIADPYFLLPLAAAGVLHMVLRQGGEAGTSTMSANTTKLLSYGFPVVSFVVTSFLPAGVQLSFFVTGIWSAMQITLFRQPSVRSFLGMAQMPPPVKEVDLKDASPYRADIMTVQQMKQREAPTTKGIFAALSETVEGAKKSAREGVKTAREMAGQSEVPGKRTKAQLAKAKEYEKKRRAEELAKEKQRRQWKKAQKQAEKEAERGE
ncbi:hypothetical protein V502_06702 [Pseudogymnoascus sp. VKM F-4520 (FW-2644)]|nr:hypothetical protein V502_06702 [Pseudogymnoascus sp. VKM F-4520 (FW-2644)]